VSGPESVLAWSRSDANRRDTVLLLVLFAIVLLPAAFYVAHYLTSVVAIAALSTPGGSEQAATHPLRTIVTSALIAILILAIVVYLEHRYAAKLVLRVADARPVAREEEPELWRIVENLSIGTGLPTPEVRVIESEATNALSAGLDPDSASIAVTRGLLDLLDYRELESVVAREMVQIGNRDTRLKTVVAALVATLWLPPMIVYRFFRFLFGLHPIIGIGCLLYLGLPLVGGLVFALGIALGLLDSEPGFGLVLLGAMLLPIYAFLIAPLAGVAIRSALARERELLADADAVLLTRNPAGLRRALTAIRDAGRAAMPVTPASAHLFAVDPRSRQGAGASRFLRTHPPLEKRIELLARMAG
jgi:heat shock protein HtpX